MGPTKLPPNFPAKNQKKKITDELLVERRANMGGGGGFGVPQLGGFRDGGFSERTRGERCLSPVFSRSPRCCSGSPEKSEKGRKYERKGGLQGREARDTLHPHYRANVRERKRVCVCVCKRERQRVCVRERERGRYRKNCNRERESVCKRERERERVCVCVCVSAREKKKRERESV